MLRAGLVCAFILVSACASLDPPVPYRLPDDDWALGVTVATAWDEADSVLRGGALLGLDGSWLDDVFGLHAGVRLQREGRGERLSGLVEASAWYVLLMGLGLRLGATIDAAGPQVPRFAVDLTLLVALPIPLWRDCLGRRGALVIAPYARPGFRLSGRDPDPDDLRGFHELGVMLRWTSYAF